MLTGPAVRRAGLRLTSATGAGIAPESVYRTDGLCRGQGGGIATPEGGTSQGDGGAGREAHPPPSGILPCLGLEGIRTGAPPPRNLPGSPERGGEGEKGKEGVAASHVGFALCWSCRSVIGCKWGFVGATGRFGGMWGRCQIGFVGSVWGFYGFWAIFVVKPPSFCDNSSKFGCFLRFSGFSMPFSVVFGLSVASPAPLAGCLGPSRAPRLPVPRQKEGPWGPRTGHGLPSFTKWVPHRGVSTSRGSGVPGVGVVFVGFLVGGRPGRCGYPGLGTTLGAWGGVRAQPATGARPKTLSFCQNGFACVYARGVELTLCNDLFIFVYLFI